MSTKAEIQASNDSIRNDVDLITPDEDCDNRDLYADELFPTLINVLSSETTYATATDNSDFPYDFLISKNGGRVSVNGKFRNLSGMDLSTQVIAEITDTELLVSAAQVSGVNVKYMAKAKNPTTGHICTISIQDVGGDTIVKIEDGFVGASTSPYELLDALTYNTKN